MIPLTVVSDVDCIARSKDRVGLGIIKASSVLGAVFDLEPETKSISAEACQVTGRETHPSPAERWVGAAGTGDDEGVLGEGAQDSTGIFEEFDRLVAGVCDRCSDLHVL